MGFYILISILILIACILLALVVLIQNPKGGGLSSTFGGAGNQIAGVRKTGDFLEKATWGLAISLLTLSILSSFVIPRGQSTNDKIKTNVSVDETILPNTPAPALPMPEQPSN